MTYTDANEESPLPVTSQQETLDRKIGEAIMQPQISIPRCVLDAQVKRIYKRYLPSGLSDELAANLNRALIAAHDEQAKNAILREFVSYPLRYLNA